MSVYPLEKAITLEVAVTFPETRESLLVLLRDADNREAWEQFVRIYRPIVYRLARQRGLQDADAQDLSQQFLVSVANSIERWEKTDPSTRFRHWIRKVARNAIVNTLTRRPQDEAVGGGRNEQQLAETSKEVNELEAQIESEYCRELYLQAADIVRMEVNLETWMAFELTVVQGRDIATVASEIGKSVGTVYASRSRVMRRLRDVIARLEGQDS